jgi:hypothetical protein
MPGSGPGPESGPEKVAPGPGRRPRIGVLGFAPDAEMSTDQFAAIQAPVRKDAPKPRARRARRVRRVSPAPAPAVQLVPAAAEAAEHGPAISGPAVRREARAHAGRRYRVAGGAVAVVAILTAGSVAHAVLARPRAAASPGSAQERAAAIREMAAAWVAGQVSRTAVVACDPVMCAALLTHGIDASDLLELRPDHANPRHAAVIVATAAVRSQLGSRLTSVYAPDVMASFGGGGERIDVRAIAPHGAAAYAAQLRADLLERKESGAELLHSDRIVVGRAASAQLAAGQVDSRLLVTMAALAALHPLDVVAFGDPDPGASLGVSPLRSAELAQAPGGKQLSATAFAQSLLAFLAAQRAPLAAASSQQVRLGNGRIAVRVEFAAPSLLGLLAGGGLGQPSG